MEGTKKHFLTKWTYMPIASLKSSAQVNPLPVLLQTPVTQIKNAVGVAKDHMQIEQLQATADALINRLDKLEERSYKSSLGETIKLFKESEDLERELAARVKHSPVLKKPLTQLSGRVCSLRYRAQTALNKAEEIQPERSLVIKVLQKAKSAHSVYKQLPSSILSASELLKIDQFLKDYPAFAALTIKDPDWAAAFVKSVLLRNIPVNVFVEFIHTTLEASSIAITRFGRFSGMLQILPTAGQEWQKQVTLPYVTKDKNKLSVIKRVNILNPNERLTLEGGLKLKVSQMIKMFRDKPIEAGSIEMYSDGVRGFHCGQFGWATASGKIKPMELSKDKEWYKKVPTWQVLTTAQANEKYGAFLHGEPLNGSNWMVALCSAAQNTGRKDILGVHGYQVIVAPLGDGTYTVLPLGKVPKKSPDLRSDTETASFIANTDFAEIQLDTNYFTENRVHGMICYSVSQAHGEQYMNQVIARDIQDGRDNKLLFQFPDQNCTEWVITRFKELKKL